MEKIKSVMRINYTEYSTVTTDYAVDIEFKDFHDWLSGDEPTIDAIREYIIESDPIEIDRYEDYDGIECNKNQLEKFLNEYLNQYPND